MRSERYKMITEMIRNGSFNVIDRRRVGDTEYVSARILDSMFFQLTQEEVIDGINGYLGCNSLVTDFQVNAACCGSEFVELDITMKDVHRAKPSNP